jgi:Fe-S-cluster containining protein
VTSGAAVDDGDAVSAVEVPTKCTDCGCCCFSNEPDYIAVFEVDWQRMGPKARALCLERNGRRFMRFAAGRCSALELSSGGSATCSIYLERPDACRWLEQGSGECRRQITAKSERVRSALLQIALER